MKYQVLNHSSIPAYVEAIPEVVRVLGDNRKLEIEEVGDGNLNYVFKIRNLNNAGAEVVLKQAVPYLRMVGEEWPLSRDRMRYEIRALKLYNELTPDHAPKIYFADEEMSLVIMQCLDDHIIFRHGMIGGVTYPNVVEHITTFLAETLFKTSSLHLASEDKRKLMDRFTLNAELCKLTENFIFSFPYMEHESNYSNPATDAYAKEWRKDPEYKKQILKFKDLFMNKTDALLHGDIHTGSLMVNQKETYVIDMEFAFYGPFSFDVGKLMGNYMLAYTSHFYYSDGDEYQNWLMDSIVAIWELFKQKFLSLWRSQKESALILEGYFSESEAEDYRLKFMHQMFQEAIGFAACTIARRTVGIAGVPDIRDIEDESIRSQLEVANLNLSKLLMNNYETLEGTEQLRALLNDFYTSIKLNV